MYDKVELYRNDESVTESGPVMMGGEEPECPPHSGNIPHTHPRPGGTHQSLRIQVQEHSELPSKEVHPGCGEKRRVGPCGLLGRGGVVEIGTGGSL